MAFYLPSCVSRFYDEWKVLYIRHPPDSQLFVFAGSHKTKVRELCVSEGQGYGMVIVAFMAGYDPLAQKTYDGLYYYYKAHPSKNNGYLMAWAQNQNFRNKGGSSATDGDMNIAFSLLLANVQWGNKGPIHYLEEAKKMIAAIVDQKIDRRYFPILKGNSVGHDSEDSFGIRPSDFMPSHLRFFAKFSNDSVWLIVLKNNYQLFDSLQDKFGNKGLLPDFIWDIYGYKICLN